MELIFKHIHRYLDIFFQGQIKPNSVREFLQCVFDIDIQDCLGVGFFVGMGRGGAHKTKFNLINKSEVRCNNLATSQKEFVAHSYESNTCLSTSVVKLSHTKLS